MASAAAAAAVVVVGKGGMVGCSWRAGERGSVRHLGVEKGERSV